MSWISWFPKEKNWNRKEINTQNYQDRTSRCLFSFNALFVCLFVVCHDFLFLYFFLCFVLLFFFLFVYHFLDGYKFDVKNPVDLFAGFPWCEDFTWREVSETISTCIAKTRTKIKSNRETNKERLNQTIKSQRSNQQLHTMHNIALLSFSSNFLIYLVVSFSRCSLLCFLCFPNVLSSSSYLLTKKICFFLFFL